MTAGRRVGLKKRMRTVPGNWSKLTHREADRPTTLSATPIKTMGSEEPSGDEAIPAKKLRDGTSDAARRDELLRYLQRTAGTEGPRRDLIFLESVGSVFGIPPDLAELVETDAVDDRAQAISARVGGTDEDTRVGVARFLVSAHRNLVGVEALNVLSVTLMLVEEELVDPANVPELATGLLNLPLQTP